MSNTYVGYAPLQKNKYSSGLGTRFTCPPNRRSRGTTSTPAPTSTPSAWPSLRWWPAVDIRSRICFRCIRARRSVLSESVRCRRWAPTSARTCRPVDCCARKRYVYVSNRIKPYLSVSKRIDPRDVSHFVAMRTEAWKLRKLWACPI